MKVSVGNPFAMEAYRLPESDDPERVHFRPIEGEQSTEFLFPEDLSVSEALIAVVNTLPIHMDLSRGAPPWIEADDTMLKKLLCSHFGVNEKKRRPAKWGDGTNGPYTTPSEAQQ